MLSVLADQFAALFGLGRGGGTPRHRPVPGCLIAGPLPYRWYALVDPRTLEHEDSFQTLESARHINDQQHQCQMLIVGMSGEVATKGLGRIDPHGHDLPARL